MKNRFATVCFRLMKYAMLMGFLGGIASFIGPPHHGLIKAGMLSPQQICFRHSVN